ncbi:sodium-extruding oxaloacetate decarboxylase subunit alpha [Thermococcus argininiproducens]|uniref:Sodium-extruding oxaloacetate decarboxylase subunit alpha n=1 Tax=Thermococcus argininiproducens TaxID=2866384 RepID=A0A9E7SD07_9EURY|nr:sodium-extruding oxaloacetate decarboxylase subunit alpha [Thermococcus argininiproducens]USH00654.1 sodium-extruding oxaloacetate decarboxylase subunit alpha [Thermococcus argininiproducens]
MVRIIDTTLRDAHQSLIATRLSTTDMLPIAEKMDKIGFYSMEVWGGATFDAALRFLREDPWERLRVLREYVRKTKLQMLLRGQNVVGYKHYPDDVVEKFVELAHKNGIDIFRVFDALNDVRNMKTAIKKAKEVGAEVQGAISYTTGKVFTLEYYMKKVDELIELDVDYITIKDMAALLDPQTAYDLVREIKERYGIKVNVHTHATSGLASATYLKAVEAGADFIDTAIYPLANGTAQPAIQSIYYSLRNGDKPKLDMKLIFQISRYLRRILEEKYEHLMNKRALHGDPNVLIHQIPGGMYSNLISQLREMKALDKLETVLEEVPKVREELGYPPLVTPTSQIVGTQAVFNVLFGRYKMITEETKNYVKGLYGIPPAQIKEEIKQLILGDEEPIAVRPADLLEPLLEKARRELEEKGYLEKEEDILTYALFPQVALEFFELRKQGKLKPVEEKPKGRIIKVYVAGREYEVGIEGVSLEALVIPSYTPSEIPMQAVPQVSMAQVSTPAAPIEVPSVSAPSVSGEGVVTAPMPGKILRVLVKEGDEVKIGEGLLVLEAMKMENEIPSPVNGVVKRILVKEGDTVDTGQPLIELG